MNFFSKMMGWDARKKKGIKDEINIMEAVNAHIKWKIRLENYISGTSEEELDPAVVCRDDQCDLGKWIHGPAVTHFQQGDELKELREDHAQFHIVAGKIVSHVQENNKTDAQALMHGEYLKASRNVVRDLTELNKLIIS